MASEFKPECLAELTSEIALEDTIEQLMAMLEGKSKGRFVVKI